MPPVATQRSGPVVVWLVIGWIIGVVALVFAIYFYVDSDKSSKLLATKTSQYNEVLTPEMLNSEDISKLKAAKDDPNSGLNGSMKLMDVALAQRNNLAKLINGSEDPTAATIAAKANVEKAKSVGAKVPGDSLGGAVDGLVTEVNARKAEAENNKKDSDASKLKLAQAAAAAEAQLKTFEQTTAQIRAEKDAALQQLQQVSQNQQGSFNKTADEMRQQLQAAQNQINQVNSQNAELGANVKKLESDLDRTRQRLNEIRVDPTKSIIRQPDGHIVRVPGSGMCFIDLGQGDHINPGLTFEVFDKVDGIPPAGDPANDENLPIGKASIEVIRVFPTSAECRITRMSPGAALSEGDLIVNLVYDRNTKYNFLVYGNFDLDQNNVATPQDAEVIKRLITQWGGQLTTEINANTDFVVLGKEPVVPDRPKDAGPIEQAAYDKAVADAEAYADISAKARAYRIPILNQNRFLYLVGYYDQSKR